MEKTQRVIYGQTENGTIKVTGKTQRLPASGVNKNGGPIKPGTLDKKTAKKS